MSRQRTLSLRRSVEIPRKTMSRVSWTDVWYLSRDNVVTCGTFAYIGIYSVCTTLSAEASLPLPPSLLVVAGLLVSLSTLWLSRLFWIETSEMPRCCNCDYDVRGADVCPECGTPVTSASVWTDRVRPSARRLLCISIVIGIFPAVFALGAYLMLAFGGGLPLSETPSAAFSAIDRPDERIY